MHERYLAELPAGLVPDPLPRKRSRHWSWRGTEVHTEYVGDPDSPRRAILLHGAGGHAAALWPYAVLAAVAGFHVAVPDLPGYGRTVVPSAGRVRYPDWVELACALTERERREHDGELLLIGASMGGMLAYEAASRTGAADWVLATCLLDPRESVAREHIGKRAWQGRAAGPLLRVLAGPLADVRVPIRWLANMSAIGNRPSLTELVTGDRRGGGSRVPLGFLRSFLTSAPSVEPEDAAGFELVLAQPARDRWTPPEVSLPFFERLGVGKKLVLLPEAGHFPVEEPGVRVLAELLAVQRSA
ncbi:alpha/beta hydrolase [Saccharomonospora sp. NPDC006951]